MSSWPPSPAPCAGGLTLGGRCWGCSGKGSSRRSQRDGFGAGGVERALGGWVVGGAQGAMAAGPACAKALLRCDGPGARPTRHGRNSAAGHRLRPARAGGDARRKEENEGAMSRTVRAAEPSAPASSSLGRDKAAAASARSQAPARHRHQPRPYRLPVRCHHRRDSAPGAAASRSLDGDSRRGAQPIASSGLAAQPLPRRWGRRGRRPHFRPPSVAPPARTAGVGTCGEMAQRRPRPAAAPRSDDWKRRQDVIRSGYRLKAPLSGPFGSSRDCGAAPPAARVTALCSSMPSRRPFSPRLAASLMPWTSAPAPTSSVSRRVPARLLLAGISPSARHRQWLAVVDSSRNRNEPFPYALATFPIR